MKIFKYMFMTLALLAMVSCKDNTPAYEWAEKPTNAQVYFNMDQSAEIKASYNQTSFSFIMNRVKTDDAITVPLTITCEKPYSLSFPSSVSFAAGQSEAKVSVTYDPVAWDFDNTVTFTAKIAQEDLTTIYGLSELTFTAVIPSSWTSLGKCTLYDDFYSGIEAQCEVQRNDVKTNVYKLIKPFGINQNPTITLLKKGDVYKTITIDRDNLVGWDDIKVTLYDDVNYVQAMHPGRFTSADLCNIDVFAMSQVTEYQENGIPKEIEMCAAYYIPGLGGWTSYCPKGQSWLYITFPDVK